MAKYLSYSRQRHMLELQPDMTLLTNETLETDIRLVSGVFDLKLSVTSEEYNRLLSACIEGAYAAFPDDYNNVIAPLILAGKRLADTMTCEGVADCIESNALVQQALIDSNDQYGTTNPDYLSPSGTESTTIINNRFPPAERELPIHEEPPTCDLDMLWAGIRYMVERIDDNGRQMLERIVTKVDVWQRIIEFAGTVPLVGELAENVLKAFVESVPDLLNAYNSHSSAAELDNIACDLFEMVCAECRYPTFQELADYYASFGISGIQDWNNLALKAIVDYVTGSNGLAGLVVYFTVNTFQLWVLYAEATFVNARKAKTLKIWADIGEDNPNNGWELLCNACGTEYYLNDTDFQVEAGIWTLPYGRDANGVSFINTGSGYLQSVCYYIFPANVNLIKVEVVENRVGGGGGFNDSCAIRANTNSDAVFPVGSTIAQAQNLSAGVATRCFDWIDSAYPLIRQMQWIGRNDAVGVGDAMYIQRIKVWIQDPSTGFISTMTLVDCTP